MSEPSPMRRKIGASRRDAPPPPSPQRVWRRAVVHGLTRGLGLEVAAREAAVDPCLPDAAIALMQEGTLAALLDSPGGYGVAMLDAGSLSALVEWQTAGRLRAVAAAPRRPTATDAAMVADLLDRILSTQEAMVAELAPPRAPTGFRYATALAEPREIGLHLSDSTHDHWRIDLALGPDGKREGRLDLVLPREPSTPQKKRSDGWERQIEARVMGCEIALTAQLARVTMGADRLRALAAGERITLPMRTISTVRVLGPGGDHVAIGRLGQSAGRKALRIETPPADTFVAAGGDG